MLSDESGVACPHPQNSSNNTKPIHALAYPRSDDNLECASLREHTHPPPYRVCGLSRCWQLLAFSAAASIQRRQTYHLPESRSILRSKQHTHMQWTWEIIETEVQRIGDRKRLRETLMLTVIIDETTKCDRRQRTSISARKVSIKPKNSISYRGTISYVLVHAGPSSRDIMNRSSCWVNRAPRPRRRHCIYAVTGG
jgi:hypothetical protein